MILHWQRWWSIKRRTHANARLVIKDQPMPNSTASRIALLFIILIVLWVTGFGTLFRLF